MLYGFIAPNVIKPYLKRWLLINCANLEKEKMFSHVVGGCSREEGGLDPEKDRSGEMRIAFGPEGSESSNSEG